MATSTTKTASTMTSTTTTTSTTTSTTTTTTSLFLKNFRILNHSTNKINIVKITVFKNYPKALRALYEVFLFFCPISEEKKLLSFWIKWDFLGNIRPNSLNYEENVFI